MEILNKLDFCELMIVFLSKIDAQIKLQLFSETSKSLRFFCISRMCVETLLENYLEHPEPTQAPVRAGDIFFLSFF